MSIEIDRRDFLKTGAAAVAAFQAKNVLGANDRVRIAVLGLRGRGLDHIQSIHATPNVELAAICDIDESVIASAWAASKSSACPSRRPLATCASCWKTSRSTPSPSPRPITGIRLMGIWACQAGKDVYVEKPCSHSWWEGKQLVAAANKYNRIVQHGTQSRSSIGAKEAIQHLRDGLVGDVYLARGLCYKWRATIGRTAEGSGARGRELRSLAGAGARPRFHAQPLPLQLALVLGHRQRRPGQPGHSRSGYRALGPGRGLPHQGFRHRRPRDVR